MNSRGPFSEQGAFTPVALLEFEWGYTIETEEWNVEFEYFGPEMWEGVTWSGRIRGRGMGFEPISSPNGKEPGHSGTIAPPSPLHSGVRGLTAVSAGIGVILHHHIVACPSSTN